jgi:sugar lactone lactonase YvrE
MPCPSLRSSTLRGSKAGLLSSLVVLMVFAALTGCGIGKNQQSTADRLELSGQVHGGQQPVSGAAIQLYTVGNGGNGSAAKPMLDEAVFSDANGNFNITKTYQCTAGDPIYGDQVYLVATGGNPGLASGTDNRALVMMAALGDCNTLGRFSYILINEVTTAAAAWAVAPFAASAGSIGSSSTNAQGIANALLNAQLLASSSTGLANALPANLSIESGKLYALADALGSCVNSDGTTGCQPLFAAATPASGIAPTDTFTAALNIVKHPGENVLAVFNAIGSDPAFPTTLLKQPNDWTMSLTVSGGGLNLPASLAIDSYSNLWVADYAGALSAFSPQGTPFNATGYGVGTLGESFGLTIDPTDNIWVTNQEIDGHGSTRGSVTAFLGAGSAAVGSFVGGTSYFADTSIDFPDAIAADPNGNILIANSANSSVTVFNSSGGLLEGGLAEGDSTAPDAITPDLNHGFWLANQGATITHIAADGSVLGRPSCCDSASALATDSSGNVWAASFGNSSVSEVSNANLLTLSGLVGGGIADGYPSGIAVDAAQNIWVVNYFGNTLSELAGNANDLPAGSPISPASGYGLDAILSLPFSVATDRSGNLWVSNFGASTVTEFFGLATPTATPKTPSPVAP